MTAEIINGDVMEFCREYHGNEFHALLCDPPYNLTSITKRFGAGEPEHTKTAKDTRGRRTPHARQAKGFMNSVWDTDIAFHSDTWKSLAALLYPGAFIVAFSGSRGWHRQAIAMEDAGLIMHPTIMLWAFGNGFPKSTKVKDARFEGYGYGMQALKPAVEPILVFQKPYKGRPQDNIIRTGAGAINLDGGRIAVNLDVDDPRLGGQGSWKTNGLGKRGIYRAFGGEEIKSHPAGRLPSNLILQHLPECICLGTEKRRKAGGDIPNITIDRRLVYQPRKQREQWRVHGDEDGNETVEKWECAPDCPVLSMENQSDVATRFFFKSNWQYEESDPYLTVDAGQYIPKASTAEREAGLIGKLPCVDCGEMDSETHPDPTDPDRLLVCRRNVHPTIKAINLTRYLATLLLPPEDYAPRRLLVPFSGAGSEVIGAELAGWDDVTGIEMGEEYVNLANLRIEHWQKNLPRPYTVLEENETPIQQILF